MQNIKIPQNVQVQDKLIGPLSLKQIILIGLGGGFSYMLFAGIRNSVGYVPASAHIFIWLPAILTAAFAVVRINDISLFRYCLLVIEMMSKPRKRSWQPREGLSINIQTRPSRNRRSKKAEDVLENTPVEEKQPVRLDELSVILDSEHGAEQEKMEIEAEPLESNVDTVRST